MRNKQEKNGVSVQAISGTYVVTLGMDVAPARRKGLLGFAIRREDHEEMETFWMRGIKTFQSVVSMPAPGQTFSFREHPFQSFLWADYTAKPGYRYTYEVYPAYGAPGNLELEDPASVSITTEIEDDGIHSVYFNRGVAGSQAYSQKFKNVRPDKIPGREAYKWLSRGLEEALLEFISQANGPQYALRAAVYEFNYRPVLDAFKSAEDAQADVKIVYDAKAEGPGKSSEKAAKEAGISGLLRKRATNPSYISHNKFIVLLKNGQPEQVWTGSTNITEGGIFGQANVGHIVRDPSIANAYLEYWKLLNDDPEAEPLRGRLEKLTPDLEGPPGAGTTPVFSPRNSLNALKWYADQAAGSEGIVAMTVPFTLHEYFKEVFNQDKEHPRYLLLEKEGAPGQLTFEDSDVSISVGSHVQEDVLYSWTKEKLTGFNTFVKYIHAKILLLDPLSAGPAVISGSANFSKASTISNDENMLVIAGDKRVADIYLGEYMRLFNHFYSRYHAQRLSKPDLDAAERARAFLREDDGWTAPYFKPGNRKHNQRIAFSRS